MTIERLREKIKNKETVWVWELAPDVYEELDLTKCVIKNIDGDSKICYAIKKDKLGKAKGRFYFNTGMYETELEARHDIAHNHVIRTETLPYVTWKDFNNYYKPVYFTSKRGYNYVLLINFNTHKIVIGIGDEAKQVAEYPLTEQGFYDAYEECKDIFLKGII